MSFGPFTRNTSITNQSLPAQKEWVKFACPSNESFRQKKIDFISDFVNQYHPDVISLDFIRHFTYWEKVYPEMLSDSLPNTCFDSRCLNTFQAKTGISIPDDLTTVEIYSWITHNHFETWVDWKSNLITSMVEEIFGVARSYKANANDSLAVIIPKTVQVKMRIEIGTQFVISSDGKKITYKPK